MCSERMANMRRVLALAAALLLTGPRGIGYADERKAPAQSEYQVKAAFVYNFVKFVEWPAEGGIPEDTVRLCLLGEPLDVAAFENLNGQEVRGKRMAVVVLPDLKEARSCDVLFLSANQPHGLPEIIRQLKGNPTLTVSDTDGYARRGVMINMFLENKRVRFEINEERARAAGLRISAKLLKLASKVYGATMNEDHERTDLHEDP